MTFRHAPILALMVLYGCNLQPPEGSRFLPPYAEQGCWARLYEGPGFEGPMRQMDGPEWVESVRGTLAVVPDMGSAGLQPLLAEVRSVRVGPNARVIGYAEPLFRGEAVEFGPGASAGDVTGFGSRIASLRVDCVR